MLLTDAARPSRRPSRRSCEPLAAAALEPHVGSRAAAARAAAAADGLGRRQSGRRGRAETRRAQVYLGCQSCRSQRRSLTPRASDIYYDFDSRSFLSNDPGGELRTTRRWCSGFFFRKEEGIIART